MFYGKVFKEIKIIYFKLADQHLFEHAQTEIAKCLFDASDHLSVN